jgi:hypothetical protein
MAVLGCLIGGHIGCREGSIGCQESAAWAAKSASGGRKGAARARFDFAGFAAADKKAAPARGKPGAGAAEVSNAQTLQIRTLLSYCFVITRRVRRRLSILPLLHGRDAPPAAIAIGRVSPQQRTERPMVPGRITQFARGAKKNAMRRRLSPNCQLVHLLFIGSLPI